AGQGAMDGGRQPRQQRRDTLVPAAAEHSGTAEGHRAQLLLGRLDSIANALHVREQPLPGRRQRELGTAATVDELHTDRALERGKLLAHSSLRIAELRGGPVKRPLGCERLERSEVADLDSEPRPGPPGLGERVRTPPPQSGPPAFWSAGGKRRGGGTA